MSWDGRRAGEAKRGRPDPSTGAVEAEAGAGEDRGVKRLSAARNVVASADHHAHRQSLAEQSPLGSSAKLVTGAPTLGGLGAAADALSAVRTVPAFLLSFSADSGDAGSAPGCTCGCGFDSRCTILALSSDPAFAQNASPLAGSSWRNVFAGWLAREAIVARVRAYLAQLDEWRRQAVARGALPTFWANACGPANACTIRTACRGRAGDLQLVPFFVQDALCILGVFWEGGGGGLLPQRCGGDKTAGAADARAFCCPIADATELVQFLVASTAE